MTRMNRSNKRVCSLLKNMNCEVEECKVVYLKKEE